MHPQAQIPPTVDYMQCDWGDRIVGTKAELQALGIGLGTAFPGEEGANKRALMTRDPRGYAVELRADGDGHYEARLTFPNWPERPSPISPEVQAFPGVTRQAFCDHSDRYVGRAAALIAAGLLQAHQLPGMPGMRKTRVTIYADGSMPSGPKHVNRSRAEEPGARCVQRVTRGRYSVQVRVAQHEAAARRRRFEVLERAWRAEVASRVRPAILQRADDVESTGSAAVISLAVWRMRRKCGGDRGAAST